MSFFNLLCSTFVRNQAFLCISELCDRLREEHAGQFEQLLWCDVIYLSVCLLVVGEWQLVEHLFGHIECVVLVVESGDGELCVELSFVVLESAQVEWLSGEGAECLVDEFGAGVDIVLVGRVVD